MKNNDRVIQLLEEFLKKTLTSEEVLAAWPSPEVNDSKLLFRCWDAIYDYNVDSDIRAKDPDYDTILRARIRDRLMELKSAEMR